MNEQNDTSNEYDALRRRYRDASNETPPPAIDAAIRSAARSAVAPGDDAGPRRARWQAPAAVAAVVLLSLSLVLRIDEVPEARNDAAQPSSPAAPAEAQRSTPRPERQSVTATPDVSDQELQRAAEKTRSTASDADATTVGIGVDGARRERAAASEAVAPQMFDQAAEPLLARPTADDAPFDAATLEALAAVASAWEAGDGDTARRRLAELRAARPELTDAQLARVLPPALIAP